MLKYGALWSAECTIIYAVYLDDVFVYRIVFQVLFTYLNHVSSREEPKSMLSQPRILPCESSQICDKVSRDSTFRE